LGNVSEVNELLIALEKQIKETLYDLPELTVKHNLIRVWSIFSTFN